MPRPKLAAGTEPDEDQQDGGAHRGLVAGQDAATHRAEHGPPQRPGPGGEHGDRDLGDRGHDEADEDHQPVARQRRVGVADEGGADDDRQGDQPQAPGEAALVEEQVAGPGVRAHRIGGQMVGRSGCCTAPRYWPPAAFSGWKRLGPLPHDDGLAEQREPEAEQDGTAQRGRGAPGGDTTGVEGQLGEHVDGEDERPSPRSRLM